jgi:predicted esterase
LIKKEVKLLGSAQKVFLAGFSQGSCLAIAVYLLFSEGQLGGVFGVSGANCCDVEWVDVNVEERSKTPLFLFHGGKDPNFKLDHAKKSLRSLKARGFEHIVFKTEPKARNELTEDAMSEISNFTANLMVDPVATDSDVDQMPEENTSGYSENGGGATPDLIRAGQSSDDEI